MEIKTVLEGVQKGSLSIEEAERFFTRKAYEDMGYAKLDTYRELRSGFPEVVYCPNKPDAYLQAIYLRLLAEQGEVFGTRATPEQAELVRQVIPSIMYSPLAKTLKLQKPDKAREGLVAVCTAGTADVPVAEEAAQTAEFFGARVERYYDVGVSGLHRLVSKMEALQKANCIVAVAGMEGALASVVGGLCDCPVIAVPTSVGYGAAFGGVAALLSMLNSCASGVSVVNIDNGFGAGYLASMMNHMEKRQ